MRKILFLDCDGVINDENSLCCAEGTNPSCYKLDRRKLDMIKDIKKDTGCEVILSSVWRLDPEGIETLKFYGLEIDGVTPQLGDWRGYDISEWLRKNTKPEEKVRYAIIDDDGDMLQSQLPYFFQTDPLHGMTKTIQYRVSHSLNNGSRYEFKEN